MGVSGRRRQGSGGHGHLPVEASAKAGEAKRQSPDAKMRARERDGLFDMGKNAAGDVRPHPGERACRGSAANANVRARVSKDEDGHCTRPHASRRIAARHGGRKDRRARRAAMLLSMRARNAFWRNEPNRDFGETNPILLNPVVPAQAGTHDHQPVFMGPGSRYARPGRHLDRSTCGCRKRRPARLLCFAPVLYREPCNSNVSSRNGGHFRQTNPTAFRPNEPNCRFDASKAGQGDP
jgi:hypothetical protein